MLKVDVADNPSSHERGLMFVESMDDDRGMLFVFKRAQPLSFWGMNTFIPLDVAFIDANDKIVKIESIQPHSMRSVSSGVPCVAAIEANAGYFAARKVSIGDKIKVDFPTSPRTAYQSGAWDGAVVTFGGDIQEGFSAPGENSDGKPSSHFKQSQMGSDPSQPVPTVTKRDSAPVGQPVTEDVNGVNLPVLSVGDLGSILEDSFDEPDQPEQQEPQPEDQEQPGEEQEPYPVFSNAFEATEWAEQQNEVVRINYTTKHGRALVRDVEPHGKYHSQSTSREILVTYDETIGDIRAFIVTNISQWAFPGRKFSKKFIVRA